MFLILERGLKVACMMLCIYCLAYQNVTGQSQLSKVDKRMFPTDTTIKIIKLPNGFTCYLKKCKNADNNVNMLFAVKAGYAFEESNELGLSHLIEHMAVFNTKHFKDGIAYFMRKGLPRDNRLATTSNYVTKYSATVPSVDKQMIADVIFHFSDIAQAIDTAEVNIEEQRKSVLLEVGRRDAQVQTVKKAFEFLTGNKKIVGYGELQNLQSFTVTDVRRLYERMYVPEREVLIIAGDIDMDKIATVVKQCFKYLKKGSQNSENSMLGFNPSLDKLKILADSNLTEKQVWTVYKRQLPALGTFGYYRAQFENEVLKTLLQIRFSAINGNIEKQGLKMVADFPQSLDLLPNFFFINKIHYTDTALHIALSRYTEEWERIMRFGFTQAELVKATEQIKNEWEGILSNPGDKIIEYSLRSFLTAETRPDIRQLHQWQMKWLDELSTNSLMQMLKSNFQEKDKYVVVLTNDERLQESKLQMEVQKLENQAKNMALSAFVDKDIVELMSHEEIAAIKPATIVSKATDQQSGVTQLLMNNGIKVVLKPIKNSGKISIKGINNNVAGKLTKTGDYKQVSNNMIFWNNMGAGKFSNTQLTSFRNFKSIISYFSIRDNKNEINVTCQRKKDLEAGLQLLYLLLNYPDTSVKTFNETINTVASEFQQTASPATKFVDSVKLALGKPVTENLDVDEIKHTDYQLLIKSFQELYNPRDFTFFIAGDFDIEAILPLVSKYLNARSSVNGGQATMSTGKDTVKYFFLNDEDVAELRMHVVGVFKDEPKQQAVLKALEEMLNMEGLVKAQQSGLVYYGGVGLVTTLQQNYDFNFYMRLTGKTYPTAVKFCQELLQRLRTGSFTDTLMNYVRNKILQDFDTNLRIPDFWTAKLAEQEVKRQPPVNILSVRDAMVSLTKQDVIEGTQQYFNGALVHFFVSLPKNENKAKQN